MTHWDGLAERTALVTGGSRGIGHGIVKALAEAGAQVFFCGRDAAAGRRAEQELTGAGLKVRFLVADLQSEKAVEQMAAAIGSQAEVDILVNNVGGAHDAGAGSRPFDHIPARDWLGTFVICVQSIVLATNSFLPAMKKKGWGRVINISSTSGVEPGLSPADYATAKGAINTLTVSLATTLAKTGITANTISPGPILTDALQSYIDTIADARGWTETGDALERRFVDEVMPLKVSRIGRPADIGAAVAFLASPAADYITGANLRIDGGLSAAV